MGPWQCCRGSRPARLVLDLQIGDAKGHALFGAYTEVSFAATRSGTQIDLVQSYMIRDPEAAWMAKGAPAGWASTLDKMEKEIALMGMQ
jgi:hypothetical protein